MAVSAGGSSFCAWVKSASFMVFLLWDAMGYRQFFLEYLHIPPFCRRCNAKPGQSRSQNSATHVGWLYIDLIFLKPQRTRSARSARRNGFFVRFVVKQFDNLEGLK
jgi:hypothetical protein